MEEQTKDVQLPPVDEPEVRFKSISDRFVWQVDNPEINEVLVEISGYDLNISFNMQYLRSVEDVESACNGIADMFRELIMAKLLEYREQKE